MSKSEVPVDRYATRTPKVVSRATLVPAVLEVMRRGEFRHVPVVENGVVVGVVSERELRHLYDATGLDLMTAADVMVKNPYVVEAGTPLQEVAAAMAARRIGSAVVARGGTPTGIFTTTDALRALVDAYEAPARTRRADAAKERGDAESLDL
jgi:acetoin utilization protein AcuB